LLELRDEGMIDEARDIGATTSQGEHWRWDGGGWRFGNRPAAAGIPDTRTSVVRSAGRALVIEAKLKSLPSLEQLQIYDERLCRANITLKAPEDVDEPTISCRIGRKGDVEIERTLLSISGNSKTTAAADLDVGKHVVHQPANHWNGVSWRHLYEAINQEVPAMAGTPLYETLKDYTQTLGSIVRIIDNVHRMSDDAYADITVQPTYGAMRREALASEFKNLRIHDLVGKTLFNHWMMTHLTDAEAFPVPTGWSIERTVHYSRAVPAITLELRHVDHVMPDGSLNTLNIGIQIQGPDCRLFLSVKNASPNLDLWISQAHGLLGDWFNRQMFEFAPVGRNERPVMPPTLPGRSTNLLVFDANKFLYSAVRIDKMSIRMVGETVSALMHDACAIAPTIFQ